MEIYSEELDKLVKRIIKKFPDNFGHIDPKQVLTLSSDKESKRAIAKVTKIPSYLRETIPYRVAMITHDNLYDQLSPNVRRLVVLHELEHIQPHPNDEDDYKLKGHDVEDWVDMIMYLGPGWVRSAKFNILDSSETDWRAALASETMAPKKKKKKAKK